MSRGRWASRWWFAALLASLLWAQVLGATHGIAHVPHGEAQHAAHAELAPHEDHAADETWLHALFAVHDDANDCRLFDALGQPGPASVPAADASSLMPCQRLQQQLSGAFVARWAALFDARGPPHSR